MIASADASAEVDVFSVGGPGRVARQQISAVGQVLHFAALGRHSVDINRSAMVLFFGYD